MMKRNKTLCKTNPAALVLAVILTANLTACGQGEQVMATNLMKQPGITEPDDSAPIPANGHENRIALPEEFLRQQTGFALELTRYCAEDAEGENMLVSPYSVVQALAMTANGANGETLAEMETVLGGETSLSTLNGLLMSLRTGLTNEEDARLSTANSVWIREQQNLRVLPSFLQTNADYYGADAYTAPFDKSTVHEINTWVSDNTDGMIPKLLDEISQDSMMYLINAVAFDAKWAVPYDDDRIDDGVFKAADGSEQDVKMMQSTEGQFLSDDHMRGFLKYYTEGYVFAAMLPEEGMTPEAYLNGLTGDALQTILRDRVFCDVDATLPQFSFDYGTELTDALSAMGMSRAFSSDADFSEISADMPLCIGSVQHKTHIEVDAQGTKAAAVTSVEVRCTSAMLEEVRRETVVLDRPFVCMILDADTMLPIFIGTVNTVA